MAATKNVKSFYRNTVIFAILAGFLLLIANSAVWTSRYIFDRENFTQVAVASLSSESSRNAIATEVSSQALSQTPVLKQALGGTIERVVSGILGTDQFKSVLSRTVGAMQVYFTTENRQTIGVDLSSTKQVIGTVLGALQRIGQSEGQAEERLNNVPDKIVILDKDALPSFYKQGIALLWLGPVAALGAVIFLVLPYVSNVRRYLSIAAIQGAAIALFGTVALLIGPLLKPPVLSGVQSANLRIVVENLYNAFVQTFNAQSQIMIVSGVFIMMLALGVYVGQIAYGRYFKKTAPKKSKAN